MGWIIHREMSSEEDGEMEGYMTQYGNFGVRSEAYVYDSYEEAEEEAENAEGWLVQEFPEDWNMLSAIEVDD